MKISTLMLGLAIGAALKSGLVALSIEFGEIPTVESAVYSTIFWLAVMFSILATRNAPGAESAKKTEAVSK